MTINGNPLGVSFLGMSSTMVTMALDGLTPAFQLKNIGVRT